MAEPFISGVGTVNVDMLFGGLSRLPAEGEELFADSFSLQLGGGVPATLLALHRLGVPVRLQTTLGADLFSHFAQDALSSYGLSPQNLYCGADDTLPLNLTAVARTAHDRTFLSYTDAQPVTDNMREQVYQASHGAAVALMSRGYLEVYEKLRSEGTLLVYDSGWREGLCLKQEEPYFALADFYLPNRKEALLVTGAQTPEDAAEVLHQYFPQVLVKLDAAGCLLRDADGATRIIPAIHEFSFVDATGAGDAFLAGFLYGLYHQRSLDECVLLGNLTGGKCVTATGCLTAFYTENALLQMAQTYHHLLE